MITPEVIKPTSPEVTTQAVIDGIKRAKFYFATPREAEYYSGPEGYQVLTPDLNKSSLLKQLYEVAFPGYPFGSLVHTEEGHRRFLQDPSQIRITIAANESSIVAAAALGTIPPDLSAEIKQVVVHPDYRGKGLSLPLVNALVEIGKLAQLQYLYMDVRTRMITMQKTALTAGFTAVGFRVGQHIVYHQDIGARREHMIHMIKFLNGAERYLDEDKHQKIDPQVVKQLKTAGLDLETLLNHTIWKP